MKDYRNEEGRTLFYEFAKRLSKTDIKQEVNDLIKSSYWLEMFDDGKTKTGQKGEETNEGLLELEALIRTHWDEVTEEILFENEDFLKSFINEDEENLYNIIQAKEESVFLGEEKIREVIPLKIKD